MPRKDLSQLIANRQPGKVEVHRGQGYELTTTDPDAAIEDMPAPVQPAVEVPKPPQVLRESAKVDKRLIKQYKLIAAQQDRNLYEVMEEALRYWLDSHNSTNGKIE
jgi:hypothetical protein